MSERTILQSPAGPVLLSRSRRRTLAIHVRPDGGVEVVAPEGASETSIVSKVRKRLRWIVRQRVRFSEMRRDRAPLRYESGATHSYLGRQYRLKVAESTEVGVRLKGRYLHVHSRSKRPAEVQALLEGWYRERARAQFETRAAKWAEWCAARGLPPPSVRLLRMPKRWGSAHRDGRIYLNPELIKAPSICVDYVIAHEICHLKHPLHSPAFYRLLGTVFPAWREVKARLERTT